MDSRSRTLTPIIAGEDRRESRLYYSASVAGVALSPCIGGSKRSDVPESAELFWTGRHLRIQNAPCPSGVGVNRADRMPEAQAALAGAMKLNPKLSVAWFRARTPFLITRRRGSLKACANPGCPTNEELGANWWRADEIVSIRHHSHRSGTRQSSRVTSAVSPRGQPAVFR
jgi:hypothetical protein